MSTHDDLEPLLAGHSPTIHDLARKAQKLVLSVKPDAHQQVEAGWGGYLLFKQVPEAGNTVCWVTVAKKHVSLGFSQGCELSDPAGLLEGTGKHSKHVKLKSADDLKRPELKALIADAWQRQPDGKALAAALERIREICRGMPQTSEKLSHGHPTFFAGKKSFAVYGLYSPSIAFKPTPATAMELASDDRFFPTPYMAQNGWWSLRLDADTDWDEARSLLEQSYRQMATKTMQAALRSAQA